MAKKRKAKAGKKREKAVKAAKPPEHKPKVVHKPAPSRKPKGGVWKWIVIIIVIIVILLLLRKAPEKVEEEKAPEVVPEEAPVVEEAPPEEVPEEVEKPVVKGETEDLGPGKYVAEEAKGTISGLECDLTEAVLRFDVKNNAEQEHFFYVEGMPNRGTPRLGVILNGVPLSHYSCVNMALEGEMKVSVAPGEIIHCEKALRDQNNQLLFGKSFWGVDRDNILVVRLQGLTDERLFRCKE